MLTRLLGALDRKVGGALLLALLACAGLPSAAGSVLAQSATGSPGSLASTAPPAIHLVVSAGPDAGSYDLAQQPLCSRDNDVAGDWTAGSSDDTGTPSLIVATFDPSVPHGASLTVGFGSDTDGDTYVADTDTMFQVDDGGGGAATITVSGTARLLTATGETPAVGTLSAVISCSSVVIGGAAAQPSAPPTGSAAPGASMPPTTGVEQTPSTTASPSAAAGSGRNRFHIELSGGPQVGSWDIASNEPCLAGADSASDWLASYSDSSLTPDSVTLALYPDQPEQSGLNVDFATPNGPLGYANPVDGPAAVVSIDDRGTTATLKVTAPVQAYDAEGTVSDAGQATVTVECGFILRNPLAASPPP